MIINREIQVCFVWLIGGSKKRKEEGNMKIRRKIVGRGEKGKEKNRVNWNLCCYKLWRENRVFLMTSD